jgi:alanine-glyoxylate transaminase/serine-glyoxylate transaminase/serine-pyruvate transaminase
VKAYGGKPLLIAGENWRGGVDVGEVERALEKNRDASILAIVHCDTPSAILNDVRSVAKIARDFGVIKIVDAVSTIGGVPVEFDNWGLDILIGGSQKVLNAPPGLTVIALSDDVWERVERVSYTGLYMSFKLWRDMLDVKNVFPYTMPDVLVHALDKALNIILEEGLEQVYSGHLKAREASWRALETLNLEPYPSSPEHSSPTVSAIIAPQSVSERKLRDYVWVKYGVLLAGSWGRLEGKVIRVGHMGLQASRTHLLKAYTALARGLKDMGLKVSVSKVVDAIENAYT